MAENPDLDLQDLIASPTNSFALDGVDEEWNIDILFTSPNDISSTSGLFSDNSLGSNGTRVDSPSEASTVEAVVVAICRICHEDDELRNLETPCSCSGSIKYVHRKCLQDWCNHKNKAKCEICQQPYKDGYEACPRAFVSLRTIEARLTQLEVSRAAHAANIAELEATIAYYSATLTQVEVAYVASVARLDVSTAQLEEDWQAFRGHFQLS